VRERIYASREWDADTDNAFALGLAMGMFMFTEYAWYWCLGYLAFLLIAFALARRYVRPLGDRLAAWARRRVRGTSAGSAATDA
jgi:hypothetical protein